ncbi:Ribonuclease BN [Botrimarina colliarenosi]|uniref:Ribonuclease BN n=1 Tax=Botrimarina colliarenosi TaxID=2528001 RepID=A0A5C6ACN8_9BACT|nr:MBL fold metallo-hydrolase [Botrimarina colliarenosi]TWT96851.1 Ribonuclease BN [Botrimarina colliarenosi]
MTTPITTSASSLSVELLGSGGYHPSERRQTACVLLPEIGLMLDAGTGAFRVLARVAAGALRADRLDIVLTHAHLDHIVGLTYLIGLACEGRPIETVIHATTATLDAVHAHLLAPALFPIAPVTRFETLGGSLTLAGGATVTTFPLDHPGGSLGLRVEARGKSLAYVTDTLPVTPATLDRIHGVDLLMHEAYFDASQRRLADDSGHCTAADAAHAAAAAHAKRLVMMHLDPRATAEDEARALAEAQAIRADAVYGEDQMLVKL